MLGSSGLRVYELHRDVQTGPVALFLAWVLSHSPRNGFVLAAIITAALGIGCVRLLELTTRPLEQRTSFELLLLVGGCLTMYTWAKLGGYGHLDDAITLAAAVVALYDVRAGRPLLAAIAVGVGIASKPWGVIFFPFTLIGAARGRHRLDWRPPVLAALVAAAAWLPFIVRAPNSLKGLRPTVNVAADSVMALFGVTTETMPDWLRVAQLIACIGVATALAIRHRPESIIAAAVAVRIATDPATWSYYTPGLVIGVLVWDLLDRRRLPWATIAVVIGLAPTWLVPSDTARAVMRLAITTAVVVWSFVRRPAARVDAPAELDALVI